MAKRRKQPQPNLSGLFLKPIRPKTLAQEKTFEAFQSTKHLLLHGAAGTGKTFLALYLALKDLLDGVTQKIYVIRSTVEVRPLGFLPGEAEEKVQPYEEVCRGMCTELLGKDSAYDRLKSDNLLEFLPTSFLRGVTLNNAVVIVDEAQNMSFQELDTVITRCGKNTRYIFCGDVNQTDLNGKHDSSGLWRFSEILRRMVCFSCIEFGVDDIVRSDMVREYLLAKASWPSYSD